MRKLLLRLGVLVALMFIALPVMAMSDTGPPGMDYFMLTGQEVVGTTTCPNNLGHYTRILGTSDPPGVEIRMKQAFINPVRGVMIAGLIVDMNLTSERGSPMAQPQNGAQTSDETQQSITTPTMRDGESMAYVAMMATERGSPAAADHENGATIEMAATARSGTSMLAAENLRATDEEIGGQHNGKMLGQPMTFVGST